MSVEPPILKQSTGRSWRDQISAWGPRHTIGDSFEMDRVGINSDGPLQTHARRRAYFSLYAIGVVALVVAGLISEHEFSTSAWFAIISIFVLLGVRARQWRRAKLP